MLLREKNAVIYGGGGAIGGAVARVFAREGARVFIAGRTQARLDAAPRGGTVHIDSGVHQGPVVIRGPLSVIAAPGAVIDGDGNGSVVTIDELSRVGTKDLLHLLRLQKQHGFRLWP